MGTKLRSFSTKTWVKALAFILVAVAIAGITVKLQQFSYQEINPESLVVAEYAKSATFTREENSARNTIEEFIREITNSSKAAITMDVPFNYYLQIGEQSYSNWSDKKADYEALATSFFGYENGKLIYGSANNPMSGDYLNADSLADILTLYLAFPASFMSEQQAEWDKMHLEMIDFVISILVLAGVTLLLLFYLFWATGRRPEDKELHLNVIDQLYTEFSLGALGLLVLAWLAVAGNLFYIQQSGSSIELVLYLLFGGATFLIASVCGLFLLSLVRKIKGKRFFKHTLCYTILAKIGDFFKSLFDERAFAKYPLTKTLFYRQQVFIGTSFLMVLTFVVLFISTPLFFFPFFLELVICYWYIKGNNKTFEEINKGFNASIEEQMKAERMKVALVTNVSHDLKTPLTSIISYVDLLAKEELPETATDYVRILGEKSARLKTIVADLFELAKASSGSLHLDLEELDLKKLIEQTLVEMEDKIELSGLQLRISLPEQAVMIRGDGKKLYRVLQNILDNALKYALPGTRVYVELEEQQNKVLAVIKNTAGYEMNFSKEDIMQRFNRGDQARSSEGSGLGLSIAESFTNVCGGYLDVSIDGDLFKVSLNFDRVGLVG